MEDKGILWNKKRWFSFCSKHQKYEKDCNMCNSGGWSNVWKLNVGYVVYKLAPKLWMWWVN